MKKTIRALSVLLSVLAIASVSLSGCAGRTSGTSSKKAEVKPSTLNYAIQSDIVSLDPAFAYDSNTAPVVVQIVEGLLAYDSNNKLVNVIAKDWKAVDSKTYVYDIRDDVKFSDGSQLSADDVVFSMTRTKDPKTASSESWMYANVSSITKTGPWQVTVKLSNPDSTWQYVPATTGGLIISQKYFEAHKSNFGKPDGGVLGTGPYVFEKWTTGSEIDLERNANYWNKAVVNNGINSIKFKVISEPATLLTALKTGQIDMTQTTSDSIDQTKSYNNVNTLLNDGYESTELAFNNQRAPFNDVNVRRAVSSAIDSVSINKNITKYDIEANALPFNTPVASFNTDSWVKFGQTAPYYKYDMQKAKQFLAQSKYAKGFDCDILVCAGSSSANASALAIQQSLKELNINLSIKKYPEGDFVAYAYGSKTDKNGKRDYDMMLWTWLSDWPDPAGYLVPLYSSANIGQGGANYAAYSNPEFDKLLDEQNQTLDTSKRTELLQKAVSIANEDAAYSVLSYPKDIFILNKKFSYKLSSSWFYNLYVKDFQVN